MKIYTIYKATNTLNKKCYVGFDSNWPSRKAVHKSSSKKGKQAFYKAICKYGWNMFEWEILYQSKDRNHTLSVMEPILISEHCGYKGGYNMTKGGEATFGWSPSLETRKKISQSNLNKIAWNKGKKMSAKAVENNRRAQLGLKRPNQKKSYLIKTPEGVEFEIIGISDFAKKHNLYAGNLVSVARGRLKQYKGYQVSYK